jgi:hexosaminidase
MQNLPVLLPIPQSLKFTNGFYTFTDKSLILLAADQPSSLLFSAKRLQLTLEEHLLRKWDISAGIGIPQRLIGITLRLDPLSIDKPQGYLLNITTSSIVVAAQDEQGLFYGCLTLIQLIQFYTFPSTINPDFLLGQLPCLEIIDWPDFPNRGIMLDISRDKVPTMNTILDLVDLLASWKINQLQLYNEHTFAYKNHPDAWSGASPFTSEDIFKLDAFCRERFIELVPNQNSFGHMERWFKHPRYRHLAEAIENNDFLSGKHLPNMSLCPLDPDSLIFLRGLYDELLPHFSSRQVNVGCDETFDLGQGRSKSECERVGIGRVYLDFLLKIYHEISPRGFITQFWADILMVHPELVKELPKDIIALEWGYEANHPFDQHSEIIAQAGLPFYVCPGTSSWNSIAGRTDNCIKNLENAAVNGMKFGAIGFLNTDWGDNGHWQCLPISYLGFATGAAFSWAFQANRNLNIQEALNHYAFCDPTGNLGRMAYDLGNIYCEVGVEPDNASFLFEVLQNPFKSWVKFIQFENGAQIFNHSLEVIDRISADNPVNSSMRSDKDLLIAEFNLTTDLLRHACMRGGYAFGSHEYTRQFLSTDLERILAEYPSVWLSRNRPGGLDDSLTYFDTMKKEYLP